MNKGQVNCFEAIVQRRVVECINELAGKTNQRGWQHHRNK
jgi:hypothetical protein